MTNDGRAHFDKSIILFFKIILINLYTLGADEKRRFGGKITMVRNLTPPDILNILLRGRIFKISDFANETGN